MSVVSVRDVGDALTRMAETDYDAAKLKRAVEAHAYIAKKKRYIAFLAATGNVEERKANAEKDINYWDEREKYFDAVEENEAMQNERKTLTLKIDVWRSLNANQRTGNI